VKTLPGNPQDGHTLEAMIPEIETQVGANLSRIVADRGYRGHNASPDHKMKVYISGQKRGVTDGIKRDPRRRSAIEPIIGHAKGGHASTALAASPFGTLEEVGAHPRIAA
jgi:IS5 family transposase